jgi:hypothetical protein
MRHTAVEETLYGTRPGCYLMCLVLYKAANPPKHILNIRLLHVRKPAMV